MSEVFNGDEIDAAIALLRRRATPTPDVAALAAEVVAVVAKATGGRWQSYESTKLDCWAIGVGPVTKFTGHGRAAFEHDAAAIVAAVNFVRDGLPALIAAQEGEVARLREALRPFARFLDCLEVMGRNTPKSGIWYQVESSVVGERTITIEDFQAARAALAGGK